MRIEWAEASEANAIERLEESQPRGKGRRLGVEKVQLPSSGVNTPAVWAIGLSWRSLVVGVVQQGIRTGVSTTSDQSDRDRVRDATDLVALIGEHVALRPRGREHVGLCPFHDDHSPSMAVVTHKGSAFYKCHSCGAAGDVFTFVMDFHKMSFPEALRYLAERAGMTLAARHAPRATGAGEITRDDLRRASAAAATFFQRTLRHPEHGAIGRELLAKRGLTEATIEQFTLGLAPPGWDGLVAAIARKGASLKPFVAAGLVKNRATGEGCYDGFRDRLIFPICDPLGQPIAFGARQIDPDDQPKYLNSPESAIFSKSATIYGLHLAKRAIIESRQAVITEGYVDTIACHQAGVTNAVATLGTALTRQHAQALRRLCETVVLVFDGDEAGQRAADRAIEVFFAEPVDVKICVLPDELDPDDLLRQENGLARFRAAIDAAEDALAFKVNRFRSELRGVTSSTTRTTRLTSFLEQLAALGFGSLNGVRKRLVLAQLADLLGVTVNDIEQSMPRAARSPVRVKAGEQRPAEPADEGADGVAPARRRAERDVLAVLISQPELVSQPLHGVGGGPCALQAAHPEGEFADPQARRIAATIYSWLASARAFTVQDLIAEFADDPGLRDLVTTMYLEGERRAAAAEDGPAAALRAASQALIDLLERERYCRRLDDAGREPAAAAAAIADAIRSFPRHIRIPDILPRGVRS